MDILSPEQRHRCMQHNKRKDTSPELVVRRALRNRGYPGYRLQWHVPGRPDIAYPGKKVAIFINGCFWHRCPMCNPSIPATNVEFWKDKFSKNVSRDKANYQKLNDAGWSVVIVWECEIKNNLDDIITRIISAFPDEV